MLGGKPKKVITEVAQAADTSGCPHVEGLIKKKNSHGQWKDRYALLQNNFFLTYKPKGSKPSSEAKETIDLKDLEKVNINQDILEIHLKKGDILLYKGSNLKDWKNCLEIRADWALLEYQKSLTVNHAGKGLVHIVGYLQKKSHNKYQGFQERLVKVEGNFLKYYKSDKDAQESGCANLATADFVRPYEQGADCTTFEVRDQDRVFVFQCASHKEMMHWVNTINQVLQATQVKIKEEKEAKIVAETPVRIRWFDELGVEQYRKNIEEDLVDIYPDPFEKELTIREHMECCNELSLYLQEFIPELQKCATRPARYDILAVTMTDMHNHINERLKTFIYDHDYEDRSELLEAATLGDLHTVIDWIAKYQITLKSIRCPVAAEGRVSTPSSTLSKTHLNPKLCPFIDLLPIVCKLYVYGGSTGAKGGAAAHLYDHCMKVWNMLVENPEEMLQQHNNGSFYTNAPIDMWEAINQHISLATATSSPILHVMIADKVVSSLNDVFNNVINYVQTVSTEDEPKLKDIELEFISGIANDTALHIEEVVNLIETFAIPEIRERIDEIFDPLTTTLVNCGQACLKRLASLVMSDVQSLVDQVFMAEWMEGNQMHVATATISDYMNDFQTFLVQFWSEKFVHTILEHVIVNYSSTLLFRKNRPPTTITTTVSNPPSSPAAANNAGKNSGFLTSFFQKTKQMTQTIVTTVPSHVLVDEESLGRLAQDVNTLNAFFSQKAGQDLALEFLQLINEISLMLFLDFHGLLQHITVRCTEFPSAAPAIVEIGRAIMKMRPEVFTKAEMDEFNGRIQPIVTTAAGEAKEKEANGEAEGKLGLLYMEVVPKELLSNTSNKPTLAQRMKMMSNIPMFGRKTQDESNNNASQSVDIDAMDEEEGRERAASSADGMVSPKVTKGKSTQLLNDVMEVLQQQDLEDENYIQEQEKQEQELELNRNRIGVLNYDGYLEKKSPAHNLWQRRFYKFATRETHEKETPYIYNLMWYKKEGGSVIKALEIKNIKSVSIVQTSRQLAYVYYPKPGLVLQAGTTAQDQCVAVQCMEHEDNAPITSKLTAVKDEYFTFCIIQSDGKEHVLRGAKVDRVMQWVNTIALAGQMAYDQGSKQWTRTAYEYYQEKIKEQSKMRNFMNISTTPLPTSSPPATRPVAAASAANNMNAESAAAAIQSLKQSVAPPTISFANLPSSKESQPSQEEVQDFDEEDEDEGEEDSEGGDTADDDDEGEDEEEADEEEEEEEPRTPSQSSTRDRGRTHSSVDDSFSAQLKAEAEQVAQQKKQQEDAEFARILREQEEWMEQQRIQQEQREVQKKLEEAKKQKEREEALAREEIERKEKEKIAKEKKRREKEENEAAKKRVQRAQEMEEEEEERERIRVMVAQATAAAADADTAAAEDQQPGEENESSIPRAGGPQRRESVSLRRRVPGRGKFTAAKGRGARPPPPPDGVSAVEDTSTATSTTTPPPPPPVEEEQGSVSPPPSRSSRSRVSSASSTGIDEDEELTKSIPKERSISKQKSNTAGNTTGNNSTNTGTNGNSGTNTVTNNPIMRAAAEKARSKSNEVAASDSEEEEGEDKEKAGSDDSSVGADSSDGETTSPTASAATTNKAGRSSSDAGNVTGAGGEGQEGVDPNDPNKKCVIS